MRYFVLILLIISIGSCDFLTPGTSSTNNDLQVLDTVIDYTKVDVYPIFTDCENYAENDDQKKCFEASLTQKLSALLNKNKLKVKERVNDTAQIDLLIDNTGRARVVEITSGESINTNLPQLDSLIRESIAQLPTVKPAVKRGIFVKSQYRVSVIVKTL